MGAETATTYMLRVKWHGRPALDLPCRDAEDAERQWEVRSRITLRTRGLGWVSLYVDGQLRRYNCSPGYGPY